MPAWFRLRARCWRLPVVLLLAGFFAAELRSGETDPFSLQFKAKPRNPPRQVLAGQEKVVDLIDFDVQVAPKQARPGETVKLTITGTPKPGYHTYSFTKRTAIQEGKLLSRLRFKKSPGLEPLWPIAEDEPELAYDNAFEGYLLKHKKKFALVLDLLIPPEAPAGVHTLAITVDLQVCDDSKCLPGTIDISAVVHVSGERVALSPELNKRRQWPQPEPVLVAPPAGSDAVTRTGGTPSGLVGFMLAGVFWGAVSLITPCVFPMIPITVSFFLKQSEKEHHRPITMALVYCGTIVIVLTIAAVALLSFFRELSTNPIMNIVIGGLFIFFALSLLGMYEIELPSGLARFTSARESKGGLLGTVFMALTFTIISFACVAPFLGGFGGTAANADMTWAHRFLGGLAFAITFASPFFVLALFPALLKRLPKSGSWLNTVKVVMGFLELAAAFKFLRTGELVITSQPVLFTYDFVLGLYIALSLLCGLYLLGVFRLPHDTPQENLGVPRMLFSLLFLGLTFYLSPALFKDKGQNQRPSGAIFAWLDSFLLPDEQEDELPWIGDLKKGLAEAQHKRKRVFIDFTGYTCTNCKLNERDVFSKSQIKDLLKRYELVALYTDKVPEKFYAAEERGALTTSRQRADAQKNLEFQRAKFDTEQLPLYVILEPLSNGDYREIDRYDEGRIIDQARFIEFLRKHAGEGPGGGQRAEAR